MAEVWFYHMTESRLEDALPQLLERTLERGWRAVVEFGSAERLAAINEHLWTYTDDSFLPHGAADDGDAGMQPVYLSLDASNPNNAQIRFHVDGALPGDVSGYLRAVMMFDGHDNEQLEAARAEWRRCKAQGHEISYWRQTPERRWEKKS
jgi:DNA polymerase III subunit chi